MEEGELESIIIITITHPPFTLPNNYIPVISLFPIRKRGYDLILGRAIDRLSFAQAYLAPWTMYPNEHHITGRNTISTVSSGHSIPTNIAALDRVSPESILSLT
jgi:hypothetical protein